MASAATFSRPVVAILLACRLPGRDSTQLPPALEILDGVPLVLLAALELRATQHFAAGHLIVLAPRGATAQVDSALSQLVGPITVLEGGDCDDASVHIALDHLQDFAGLDDAVVVIHDACRPLTTAVQIDRVIFESASRGIAAIPVLPMTESVKVLDDGGRIVKTVARDSVVRVQTPQAGMLAEVRRTHADCVLDGAVQTRYFVATSEDTQLLPGDELSMLVVTPADRELAAVWRRRALGRENLSAG